MSTTVACAQVSILTKEVGPSHDWTLAGADNLRLRLGARLDTLYEEKSDIQSLSLTMALDRKVEAEFPSAATYILTLERVDE